MSLAFKFVRPATKFATTARPAVAGMSMISVRSKHTLPDLPYDYGALEPAISGQIMELHHSKHHQTYVNGLNDAEEKYAAAVHSNDVTAQIALQPLLKFHGGGHLNHSLFWENLAPKSAGGGAPPTGALSEGINSVWENLDNFKKTFNASLAGIQGSGWSWLVKDKETGHLLIINQPNQDPIVGKYIPLLGVDAWEHAYYLQYQNRKAEYFNAIWDVVNWKAAEKRLSP
ncbi:Superoxide dismutase [Mn], mitochondrial [Rhizina undulata]